MNNLQIFNNKEFGDVRAVIINDLPWFVGKDVCKAFGDTNYRRSLSNISDYDKGVSQIDTPGGKQKMIIINESGLYSLLFQMQPQKARGVSQNETLINERIEKLHRFKHWVTSEVLPAIHKHGVFVMDDIVNNTDALIEALQAFKAERLQRMALEEENAVQKQQLIEMQPKASYYDVVLNSSDLVSITEISKDYGWSAQRMNEYLHTKGVQFKQSSRIWILYQKYAEKGYTSTKTHTYLATDGNVHTKIHTYWTQKGRLFIYDLLKNDGILPLIEQEG